MTHNLKVLTWNMANYDDWPHWEERREMMVNTIINEDPDIILFQEVRFNPNQPSAASSYQNMAEEGNRNKYLGAKIVSLPIAYYPLTNQTQVPSPSIRGIGSCEWEGLSIISKLFIQETGSYFHTRLASSNDLNPRATQFVSISVTVSFEMAPLVLYFFNSHLSYNVPQANDNVLETLTWMKRLFATDSKPLFLLAGDLNVEPHETPYHTLISSKMLNDVWTALEGTDPGLTYPTTGPKKRIDYILTSPDLTKLAVDVKRVGDVANSNGVYSSDHVGLLGTFRVPISNSF